MNVHVYTCTFWEFVRYRYEWNFQTKIIVNRTSFISSLSDCNQWTIYCLIFLNKICYNFIFKTFYLSSESHIFTSNLTYFKLFEFIRHCHVEFSLKKNNWIKFNHTKWSLDCKLNEEIGAYLFFKKFSIDWWVDITFFKRNI